MEPTKLKGLFDPQFVGHYAAIGVFHCTFTALDLSLTYLLARMCDAHSTETFNLLVGGMDARVKCERIKKASRVSCKLGSVFERCLTDFEKRIIPFRNKISHNLLLPHNSADGFMLLQLGKLPELEDKPSLKLDVFYDRAKWLTAFNAAIHKSLSVPTLPDSFEIDDPGQCPPKA